MPSLSASCLYKEIQTPKAFWVRGINYVFLGGKRCDTTPSFVAVNLLQLLNMQLDF